MFLVANWKMNMTRDRIGKYLDALDGRRLSSVLTGTRHEVVLAPTHVYLEYLSGEASRRDLPVRVFAQDVSTRTEGAFTGEVSVRNILDVGAVGSILGHSERRQYFRETDAEVARKTGLCLKGGAVPLVCFGESREEREAGKTLEILRKQVSGVAEEAAKASKNGLDTPVYLAYEPVWAIGTGKSATPAQAQAVHKFIRDHIAKADAKVAEQVIIQYGGSVNASNAAELFTQPDIDGALVGGASLKADAFAVIVKAAEAAKKA